MTDTVTPEQASAHFREVMITNGVLTPKDGMLAATIAKVTGKTEFEVHPEKVTDALVKTLDHDKVLGTREARDALGKDSLVLWGASDVKDVAASVAKAGVSTQAPALEAGAHIEHLASNGAHSTMDSLKAAMSGADLKHALQVAAGVTSGKVVVGDTINAGEMPTCQQVMDGKATDKQLQNGNCRHV